MRNVVLPMNFFSYISYHFRSVRAFVVVMRHAEQSLCSEEVLTSHVAHNEPFRQRADFDFSQHDLCVQEIELLQVVGFYLSDSFACWSGNSRST